MNQVKNQKLIIKKILSKKIVIMAISIIIVLIINPPIKHRKPNEKFYQERGIEYNIIQCPECRRDVIDRQQFCQNCGAVLFDADEQTLKVLDQIKENLKPTKTQKIMKISKKTIIYIVMISMVYYLINQILNLFMKLKYKEKKINK